MLGKTARRVPPATSPPTGGAARIVPPVRLEIGLRIGEEIARIVRPGPLVRSRPIGAALAVRTVPLVPLASDPRIAERAKIGRPARRGTSRPTGALARIGRHCRLAIGLRIAAGIAPTARRARPATGPPTEGRGMTARLGRRGTSRPIGAAPTVRLVPIDLPVIDRPIAVREKTVRRGPRRIGRPIAAGIAPTVRLALPGTARRTEAATVRTVPRDRPATVPPTEARGKIAPRVPPGIGLRTEAGIVPIVRTVLRVLLATAPPIAARGRSRRATTARRRPNGRAMKKGMSP